MAIKSETWTHNQPITCLPRLICDLFQDEADFLYFDLVQNRLEVELVHAPKSHFDGHMIRVVSNHNPPWYCSLYHAHSSFRRDLSTRALNRIRNLQDRKFRLGPFKYDSIYRELILDRLLDGYVAEFYKVPPNNSVLDFFQEPNLGFVPF